MRNIFASAHSGGRNRFWAEMGGEVTRLSWRKCQKVAPSWSGFLGAPLGVVLPSATSPAKASWSSLASKAGRSSTVPSMSAVPVFPSECGTPAGTTTVSPACARCCLAVEGEAGFASDDGEEFLLVRVDVLGDGPAGHTAPVEAHDLAVAVLRYDRVLDVLTGGRVEEGPEPGRGAVGLGSAHGLCAASGTVLGELRGRRAARSWNPAAAVPSRSTPAASPVVAARAVPDMVATRTTGPMVRPSPRDGTEGCAPDGRARAAAARW